MPPFNGRIPVNLGYPISPGLLTALVPEQNLLETSGTGFYRPHVFLSLEQQYQNTDWNFRRYLQIKFTYLLIYLLKALTQTSSLDSSFTSIPDTSNAVVFMLALSASSLGDIKKHKVQLECVMCNVSVNKRSGVLLPLMPQPPRVKEVLISHTPRQKSIVLGTVDVNAAVCCDDCGRLNVSRLVDISLHQVHAVRRHSYQKNTVVNYHIPGLAICSWAPSAVLLSFPMFS